MESEMTAAQATLVARMSRERIVRAVQRGDIVGRYDGKKGWLVDVGSLNRFTAQKPDEDPASLPAAPVPVQKPHAA